MLTGILRVAKLPPQCTFWRFLASLHLGVARQLLTVQWRMRERVWAAANVQLDEVTVDTDTTVHTLFGKQMGGRKGYNPKNKGKKSYQPILSFIAETREYAAGALRTGDRPSGQEIAAHLESVAKGLPSGVKTVCARADSGFYCWQAVEAYEKLNWRFIVVARKTARLVDQLQAAKWRHSPLTDADGQCEFSYQPEGWGKACRFLALRYEKEPESKDSEQPEQYQLFIQGLRDRHGSIPGYAGVVLQPARGCRESHQGSQQRCGLDGASVQPLDDERQLVPDRDAGLQPELLAATVQPRGERRGGNHEAHHAGHGAPPLPVSGRPHLAPCRQSRRQLQRPLPGERRVSTTHGPAA
jgi:hypothetical protein